MMRSSPLTTQCLEHVLGDAADVRIRRARCNDKEIGGLADRAQVEDRDLLSLAIVECGNSHPNVTNAIRVFCSLIGAGPDLFLVSSAQMVLPALGS